MNVNSFQCVLMALSGLFLAHLGASASAREGFVMISNSTFEVKADDYQDGVAQVEFDSEAGYFYQIFTSKEGFSPQITIRRGALEGTYEAKSGESLAMEFQAAESEKVTLAVSSRFDTPRPINILVRCSRPFKRCIGPPKTIKDFRPEITIRDTMQRDEVGMHGKGKRFLFRVSIDKPIYFYLDPKSSGYYLDVQPADDMLLDSRMADAMYGRIAYLLPSDIPHERTRDIYLNISADDQHAPEFVVHVKQAATLDAPLPVKGIQVPEPKFETFVPASTYGDAFPAPPERSNPLSFLDENAKSVAKSVTATFESPADGPRLPNEIGSEYGGGLCVVPVAIRADSMRMYHSQKIHFTWDSEVKHNIFMEPSFLVKKVSHVFGEGFKKQLGLSAVMDTPPSADNLVTQILFIAAPAKAKTKITIDPVSNQLLR